MLRPSLQSADSAAASLLLALRCAPAAVAPAAAARSVERFNPERGCWELLPSLMASERKYCAAAALGGRCGAARLCSAAAALARSPAGRLPARLDSRGAGCVPPGCVPAYDAPPAALSVGGSRLHRARPRRRRLLVLGGLGEARRRLGSLEAYDPREGRWASLASMQVRAGARWWCVRAWLLLSTAGARTAGASAASMRGQCACRECACSRRSCLLCSCCAVRLSRTLARPQPTARALQLRRRGAGRAAVRGGRQRERPAAARGRRGI